MKHTYAHQPTRHPGKKSFYFYLNIFLTIVLVIESAGTILLNSDMIHTDATAAAFAFHQEALRLNQSLFGFFLHHSRPKNPLARRPFVPPTKTVRMMPQDSPSHSPHVQQTQTIFTSNQQAGLNYYALGEKHLFGSSFAPVSLYQMFAGKSFLPRDTGFQNGNIKTVFLILMENENWSSIVGNPTLAPFLNDYILPRASYANNYFNPVGNHPSEPNYIWLEAGSNTFPDKRFTTDADPSADNQTSDSAHLTSLLDQRNISWKTYAEDISGTTCPTISAGLYAAKHNPMVFFRDVTSNPAYCQSHERPFPQLFSDLQNKTLAHYNFLVPNLCDDMHNDCTPRHLPSLQADTWLAKTLPPILASHAYKVGGLILLVWDEGSDISDTQTSDGPIGLIALSPFVKGNGYTSDIYYTHSSTLRTIEEIFNVPLLRDSANAPDLSDLFLSPQTPDVSFRLPLPLIDIPSDVTVTVQAK